MSYEPYETRPGRKLTLLEHSMSVYPNAVIVELLLNQGHPAHASLLCQIAQLCHNTKWQESLQHVKGNLIKLVLSKGVDIEHRIAGEATALHLACMQLIMPN